MHGEADEVEHDESDLGPLRFLVSPRLLAVFLLLPCLSVVSDLTALTGAALITKWAFGINYLRFIETGWTHELEQKLLLPRHALHSAKLAIEGEHEWNSPLPSDLVEFIR